MLNKTGPSHRRPRHKPGRLTCINRFTRVRNARRRSFCLPPYVTLAILQRGNGHGDPKRKPAMAPFSAREAQSCSTFLSRHDSSWHSHNPSKMTTPHDASPVFLLRIPRECHVDWGLRSYPFDMFLVIGNREAPSHSDRRIESNMQLGLGEVIRALPRARIRTNNFDKTSYKKHNYPSNRPLPSISAHRGCSSLFSHKAPFRIVTHKEPEWLL